MTAVTVVTGGGGGGIAASPRVVQVSAPVYPPGKNKTKHTQQPNKQRGRGRGTS